MVSTLTVLMGLAGTLGLLFALGTVMHDVMHDEGR